MFDEPAGVSGAGGKLYVADTNNHAVRVIDLQSRQVSTFELRQVHRLARWRSPVVRLDPLAVRPGAAEVSLTLELPSGAKWNPNAPLALFLSVDGGEEERFTCSPDGPVRLPFQAGAGESLLHLDLTAYYCRTGQEAVCLFHEENLEIPLRGDPSAPAVVSLRRAVGA